MNTQHTIAVVGNPNCGKTTLFNALTGSKQRVGNWPGVTVEQKVGQYSFEGVGYQIVDLPGTYSLDVTDQEISMDEKIARDYIHGDEAELIVNIVDASNLERNLYLTSQLLEMGRPLLVALNMMDVAEAHGMKIDTQALADQLGCPVVAVVAVEERGVHELQQRIAQALTQPIRPTAEITYDTTLEGAIAELTPQLAAPIAASGDPPRWLATRLLEGDDLARQVAGHAVSDERLESLREGLSDDIDILLADGRYGLANRVAQAAVRRKAEASRTLSDTIDRVILNRVLGIPLFLVVMYAMFMFTINIGGSFIDLFDGVSGTLFVDGLAALLASVGTPEWLILLLATGIGGGIQVVATFIPIIAFLYLFLSFLEDSGYMARAAFVMDRSMRTVGLPGKSFVPLIVGFGCNVPAIMATRTLEHHRDRILTIVMAPFMSCGARLPVYALFAAAFFPIGGQNVVFGLYLIGIAVAILTGFIMKRTLLPGEPTPFVMELPPYHLPTIGGVLTRTWDRTQGFIFRAGRLIVPMVLVLNVLNSVGTDGSFGNEESEQSVLSEIGRTIAPMFAPMGLDSENWPAAVGIFTGILAKEAVVGTLDATYTALAKSDAAAAGEPLIEEPFDLWEGLADSFATIPANLSDALGGWSDPIGVDIGDLSDTERAAAEQEVASGTFGAMAARFDGAAGAFAYLLFILLYFPCTAAIAAIYRESNWGWTLFVAGWTTGLGYAAATVTYQASILSRHPTLSLAWIGGMVLLLSLTVLIMRWWGLRRLEQLRGAATQGAAG